MSNTSVRPRHTQIMDTTVECAHRHCRLRGCPWEHPKSRTRPLLGCRARIQSLPIAKQTLHCETLEDGKQNKHSACQGKTSLGWRYLGHVDKGRRSRCGRSISTVLLNLGRQGHWQVETQLSPKTGREFCKFGSNSSAVSLTPLWGQLWCDVTTELKEVMETTPQRISIE